MSSPGRSSLLGGLPGEDDGDDDGDGGDDSIDGYKDDIRFRVKRVQALDNNLRISYFKHIISQKAPWLDFLQWTNQNLSAGLQQRWKATRRKILWSFSQETSSRQA